MKIVIDIPQKAYETIKAEKEIDWLGVEYILDCIKSGTPAEELTSIIRGKWIKEECTKTTDLFRCSRCGKSIMLCKGSLLKDFPYCHCGARMKESEEKNE